MNERITRDILLFSLSILTAFGVSCTNGPSNIGTANGEPLVKTEPGKPTSDKGDVVVSGIDLAFMDDAAPAGLAEIELSKLALTKSQNADVEEFAKKMVDDHTRAGDELKKIAVQKNVILPPDVLPATTQAMDRLSKLSGPDFDREYVKTMLGDHQKAVASFENASKTSSDPDVKDFATKILPTLKMHLDMINGIAGKMGVK